MLVSFDKKYWGKWHEFIEKCWPAGEEDPYDYDFERYEVEGAGYHELKDHLMLAVENDEIIGYFHRGTLLNFDCFSFGRCLKGKAETCLSYLKEAFPDALIYHSSYYDECKAQEALGYKHVKVESKYGGWYSGQSPMTAGDVNAYVQKVDEVVFPELTGEISYTVMSGRELSRFIQEGVIIHNGNCPCWNHNFAGFQYLSFDCLYETERDIKFLVAHMGHTLVGVIHFGVWYSGSQDISFIDVAIPYRKMGIATKMIQELNKHLYPDMPLHVSQESEMGKACHISEMFKKYIHIVPVKSHFEIHGY